MSRYSTWWEFSSLKNSLKSGGRRIMAKRDLPVQLNGFQTLQRRSVRPESLLVRFPKGAAHRDDGTINLREARAPRFPWILLVHCFPVVQARTTASRAGNRKAKRRRFPVSVHAFVSISIRTGGSIASGFSRTSHTPAEPAVHRELFLAILAMSDQCGNSELSGPYIGIFAMSDPWLEAAKQREIPGGD